MKKKNSFLKIDFAKLRHAKNNADTDNKQRMLHLGKLIISSFNWSTQPVDIVTAACRKFAIDGGVEAK